MSAAFLSALLFLCVCVVPAAAADRLAGHAADLSALSASGVSSGGYMAVQLHVARSEKVKGVGVLAGGPYYCAQGSFWAAYYACMEPSSSSPLPDNASLRQAAERFARERRIDPLANVAGARVWLFSGREDRTVTPAVVEALAKFYASLNVLPRLVADQPAGHAMVTEAAGNACNITAPPFINDCDYDAAGALLAHLLGPLAPPAAAPGGRLVAFDQKAFAGGSAHAIGMAGTGYAYVPAACGKGGCRVHIAFHGCRQNAEEVGERYMREAGYNRWADTNRLIVLYPQTISRYGWGYADGRFSYAFNPRGCWDWWGYTNAHYATKEGPQIRAVLAMAERLGQPRQP